MNKSRGDLRRFLLGAGKLRQHSAVWRVIQSILRLLEENHKIKQRIITRSRKDCGSPDLVDTFS